MIKFSIDYYNKNSFFKQFDYSNKVILNAVTDPLFIYNKKENKYLPNACVDYKIEGNTYIFTLKDNLYFYDGNKVTPQDYVDSIIDNKELLELNIISIKSKDNQIIIELKKKDNALIKKLSLYIFAPYKNKTSGRYYINNISSEQIELLPNKFYRNKANEKLVFIKLETIDENINFFNNKKIDITNNTFIMLNHTNELLEKSGIIFSIEISSKYNKNIRKKIVKSINKKNLVSALGKSYYIKNDFFFDKETKYKYKNKKNKEHLKLELAYNKYYPNKEIAELIKNELEKNNFEIVLIETTYDDFKKLLSYDLKLTLNYFEYLDDFYFYNSKYFKYIMKNNAIYRYLLSRQCMKKILNKLFKNRYFKEPLISFYSYYKTTFKTKYFSYLECDYKKIKDI